MSGFSGRRALNFSQYLDDLNTIPSPYVQAMQQQQQQQQQQLDACNIDADLALFTNTEFYDFDNLGDFSLPSFDAVDENSSSEDRSRIGQDQSHTQGTEFLNILNDGLGDFADFSATSEISAANPPVQTSFTSLPPAPSTYINKTPSASSHPSPIIAPLPVAPVPAPTLTARSASATASSPTTASSIPAKRKNTSQKPPQLSVEEAARIAAEEDKRRRNTAASARFRVKKKLREQALERTVKEATDKNTALEARVSQLEQENQWLKNLLTEKNSGKSSLEGKRSESDIAEMFNNFLASQKAGQRSPSEKKNGVGTAA